MILDQINAMHPDDVRQEIAKLCGWTEVKHRSLLRGRIITSGPFGRPPNMVGRFDIIPDYCRDLNVMHEAEEAIKGTPQWGNYVDALFNQCVDGTTSDPDFGKLLHATAKQRATAFLMVHKKAPTIASERSI